MRRDPGGGGGGRREREERREKRVGEREREFFRDCWNATCIQVIVYKHILHDFNISSKI